MFWTVCFSFSPAVNMENDRPEDFEPPVKRLALGNLEESSGSETEVEESSGSETEIEELTDSEVEIEEAPAPEINAVDRVHVSRDLYSYACFLEDRETWAIEMLDDWGMSRRRLIREEEDFPDEGVSIKFLILLYLDGEIDFNWFVYLFQFESAENEPRISEGRDPWPLNHIPQDPEDFIAPDFEDYWEVHYPPFHPDPDWFWVTVRRVQLYG